MKSRGGKIAHVWGTVLDSAVWPQDKIHEGE